MQLRTARDLGLDDDSVSITENPTGTLLVQASEDYDGDFDFDFDLDDADDDEDEDEDGDDDDDEEEEAEAGDDELPFGDDEPEDE